MHDDETVGGRPGPAREERGDPGGPEAGLDAFTRDRLGRALRAHYADLLTAPVPDRFVALLADLEAAPPALNGAAPHRGTTPPGAGRPGATDEEGPR